MKIRLKEALTLISTLFRGEQNDCSDVGGSVTQSNDMPVPPPAPQLLDEEAIERARQESVIAQL